MRYWRVSPALWDDEAFKALPMRAQILWVYVLTCAHRNAEGLYRMPAGYAATDLGWTEKEVKGGLKTLVGAGLIQYDLTHNLLFICRGLKYQAPDNPNMETAIARSVSSLPDTPLLHAFYLAAVEYTATLADRLPERFRQPLPQRFPEPLILVGVGEGGGGGEELRKVSEPRAGAKAVDNCHQVFEYWQEVMGKPQATLTAERKGKVLVRLKKYSVEQLKQAIDGCRRSPHNMGENDGHRPYNDLELICRTDTNVERFIELAHDATSKDAPVDHHAKARRLANAAKYYRGCIDEGRPEDAPGAQAMVLPEELQDLLKELGLEAL